MPMNLVIQQRRRELGFTQEQVAEYLNVSTPAVSKWETGATSPDISLLPQLARFLKMDLNTLFCFSEDITLAEISHFCQEISQIVQTEGFEAGFRTASVKLHEYPHNETLLYYLTVQIDGHLLLSGMDESAKEPYEAKILSWYRRLADSTDEKISNPAKFMLAGRYIRSVDYEKAQEILDSMPGKEDLINSMADKLMLQVSIYEKQGKAELAVRELQYALFTAVQKVQLLLNKLVDAELAAGHPETAKRIAEKSAQLPELFDLWEYSSHVAPLQVAMAEENADVCIALMRKLLSLVTEPWDAAASPLFYRIQTSANLSQMLPALLSEMENASGYEFLRKDENFQNLLAEYREKERRGLT